MIKRFDGYIKNEHKKAAGMEIPAALNVMLGDGLYCRHS